MRLKLDENLPAELAADLRECGHDVETVVEENLGGRSDRLILVAAGRERRILITLDKGAARGGPARKNARSPAHHPASPSIIGCERAARGVHSGNRGARAHRKVRARRRHRGGIRLRK
jgi:hypothetical protein